MNATTGVNGFAKFLSGLCKVGDSTAKDIVKVVMSYRSCDECSCNIVLLHFCSLVTKRKGRYLHFHICLGT